MNIGKIIEVGRDDPEPLPIYLPKEEPIEVPEWPQKQDVEEEEEEEVDARV